MDGFIRLRDRIRQFVSTYEVLVLRVWSMVIGLVGLLVINSEFGYQKALTQWYVVIVITALCALLPVRGVALLLMGVIEFHLVSLAYDVAIVGAILLAVGFLLCAYFHSNDSYNMMTIPVCYALNSPYVVAVGAGLLRNITEVASIVCGCLISYYLYIVKINASSILDETSDVSAINLLLDHVLRAKGFYFYLAAMVAMFLVVYFIRQMEVHMSWLLAVLAGAIVEFFIMLAGYITTGTKSMIPGLLLGNAIAIGVGILLNYFVLDLDYSRIEKVQFEDDDYYYYVTAVPKIRIAAEDKEIKKI